MAEITLEFDPKNAVAQKTIEFILSLGVFKKKSSIDLALEDEKKGRVKKYKNSDDMFKKILG
jgi:hypothetical protein